MPYQAEAKIVLDMWREVERQMHDAQIDSAELEYLQAEAARLRDEYQRLVEAALRFGRPVPPPFPEAESG